LELDHFLADFLADVLQNLELGKGIFIVSYKS